MIWPMSDLKLQPATAEENKRIIINLFLSTIKGKKSNTISSNIKHSGKEGHWLEKEMGLKLNASNSPDILGFEMKNGTALKTTFGDWSADYRIFKDVVYGITQDEFLRIFGKPNEAKNGRFSWSGQPTPKIGKYNDFGQMLVVNSNNDILGLYSYSQDKRLNKASVVPIQFQKEELVLCKWSSDLMRRRVESKFNQNGWFKCLKDKSGTYQSIVFGDPITFEKWIECVKIGDVFFDGGMYQGNPRPYSQWRANNKFWDNLVTSRY